MLVSILHRMTGAALTLAGLAVLTWWLLALSGGAADYEAFVGHATSLPGRIVIVGLILAFWQHTFSGLRHLVLDTGAGFELKINRLFAVLTIAGALFATALTWAYFEGLIG